MRNFLSFLTAFLTAMTGLIALASGQALCAPGAPSGELEKMEAVAGLLRVAVDLGLDAETGASPVPAPCGISRTEAESMLREAQARWDRAIKRRVARAEAKKGRKLPVSKPAWERCAENCLCGAYVSLLEKIPRKRLLPEDKALLKKISVYASRLEAEAATACARETERWFCTSPLRKELTPKE